MPEDRELYNEAMNAGHEAAWKKDWVIAANAYGKALQQFPRDPEAHLNLAFALLSAERLDESLRVYMRAYQLTPDDPIPLEKSADVLQQMGRLREAAQQYANVADMYLKQKDIDKAVSNWEKATQLTPGLVAIHAKLAQAYKRLGGPYKEQTIYQYLVLGYNFGRMKDFDRGKQAVQQALKYDRKNSVALNMLRALETGRVPSQPDPPKEKKEAKRRLPQTSELDLYPDSDTFEEKVIEDELGPMGEAMTLSLQLLANHIMSSGGFGAGAVEALQAMELQRQASYSEAIGKYQDSYNNMKHPALSLNLGVMLLLSGESDDAIKPLNDAVSFERLRPGAFHAMGQAYYNVDKYKTAFRFLAQCAQLIDVERIDDVDERREVATLYDLVIREVATRNEIDDAVGAACKRLIGLLSGQDWYRRLHDTRLQMQDVLTEGDVKRVLEFLSEEANEGLSDSVAAIDRHIRQSLYALAMDEAHFAIEKSPSYLPIHVRMAEIMMHEGRIRQAINKYTAVARTYMVRGENGRAASILSEVLEMAPLDVEVRRSLIELLENEERWDEVFEQYIGLANTYRQLGNLDSARDTYVSAERMASQLANSIPRIVEIKHEVADLDQLRMDMRRAQRVYEEIVALQPNDEKARRMLVELNLNVGNQVEAIKQLDELLRYYAQRREVKQILQLLQELVKTHPDDIGVRSRLAAIFRQLGRKDEAIVQLDKMADLQLDANMNSEACDTIRQIVALQPNNIRQYRELLASLNC